MNGSQVRRLAIQVFRALAAMSSGVGTLSREFETGALFVRREGHYLDPSLTLQEAT